MVGATGGECAPAALQEQPPSASAGAGLGALADGVLVVDDGTARGLGRGKRRRSGRAHRRAMVELLKPAKHLVDRTVFGDQHRLGVEDFVLPDGDVRAPLGEKLAKVPETTVVRARRMGQMVEPTMLCPLKATTIRWRPDPDRVCLSVCLKATWRLRHGEVAELAAEQYDFSGDIHYGADPRAPLYAASDLVPFKPRSDIVVVGTAYAREPSMAVDLSVGVGSFHKTLRAEVLGPDGQPQRFLHAPLQAFSGESRLRLSGTAPDAALTFAAVPRELRTGVYRIGDAALRWIDQLPDPQEPPPDHLDTAFFNAAPRDQQVLVIPCGATITLEGMHPDHPRFTTRLPAQRPRLLVRGDGMRDVPLRCDTLWIDADRELATTCWRAMLPVTDERFELFVLLEDAEQPSSLEALDKRLKQAPRRGRRGRRTWLLLQPEGATRERALTQIAPSAPLLAPFERRRKSTRLHLENVTSRELVMPFMQGDASNAPVSVADELEQSQGPARSGTTQRDLKVPFPIEEAPASLHGVAPWPEASETDDDAPDSEPATMPLAMPSPLAASEPNARTLAGEPRRQASPAPVGPESSPSERLPSQMPAPPPSDVARVPPPSPPSRRRKETAPLNSLTAALGPNALPFGTHRGPPPSSQPTPMQQAPAPASALHRDLSDATTLDLDSVLALRTELEQANLGAPFALGEVVDAPPSIEEAEEAPAPPTPRFARPPSPIAAPTRPPETEAEPVEVALETHAAIVVRLWSGHDIDDVLDDNSLDRIGWSQHQAQLSSRIAAEAADGSVELARALRRVIAKAKAAADDERAPCDPDPAEDIDAFVELCLDVEAAANEQRVLRRHRLTMIQWDRVQRRWGNRARHDAILDSALHDAFSRARREPVREPHRREQHDAVAHR
jgi:Uncharacterized protein conserved in bacteria (DUF2169)